jgi:hypothetical protein
MDGISSPRPRIEPAVFSTTKTVVRSIPPGQRHAVAIPIGQRFGSLRRYYSQSARHVLGCVRLFWRWVGQRAAVCPLVIELWLSFWSGDSLLGEYDNAQVFFELFYVFRAQGTYVFDKSLVIDSANLID